MKALKPSTLGLLHKPYRFADSNRLVIAVLGFFELGQEQAGLLPEAAGWQRLLKRLPKGQVLDHVMPKRRAEFLLAAAAHAPQAVTDMEVCAEVGNLRKTLRIWGDRTWFYSTSPLHGITAPQPFTLMEIEYRRAYGGKDYGENPDGCGYTGKRFGYFLGGNQGAMPNVELPNEPVKNHHKAHRPAGFGPLDLRWAPRANQAGTYDQRWLKEVNPGLPEDLNWDIFNVAPADQQFTEFLRGGEAYRLTGMHPGKPCIQGKLPAIRVRAFAKGKDQEAAAAQEVSLVCDTVWLLPDQEIGLVIYRGQVTVQRSDAQDQDALLLAYENLSDPPRSADYYRDALKNRLGRPKDALAHLVNESALKPALDDAQRKHLQEEIHAAAAAREALAQRQSEAVRAEIMEKGNLEQPLPAPPEVPPPLCPPLPQAALARGEVDLVPVLKAIDDKVKDLLAEAETRKTELTAGLASLKEATGGTVEQPHDDAQAQVQTSLDRFKGKRFGDYLEAILDVQAAENASGEAKAKLAAQLQSLDAEGRRRALSPVPQPISATAAKALGEAVRAHMQAGLSLAGLDMAGADLAGVCFAGLDLRGALLERADLRGADLRGCLLDAAVFTGACLDGAKLDGASMQGVSLNAAQGHKASLRAIRADQLSAFNAKLAGADLCEAKGQGWMSHGADLTGARLARVHLKKPLFLKLSANASQWQAAQLDTAIFTSAELSGANFGDAKLNKCVFASAQAERLSLEAAQLEKCFLGSANLRFANLKGSHAQGSSWRQAKLDGANLQAAQLDRCDLGGASLQEASLDSGKFCGSILSDAVLAGSKAQDADFYQSQCRLTDFRNADLRDTRFHQADLAEACFDHADLRGASYLPAHLPLAEAH